LGLVSFVRAEESTADGVRSAIERSLALIKFGFSKKVNEIVIKPNMCYYYHPSTGQVTDPTFVGAIIDVIREHFSNPHISIVESDASAMKCKYAFRMLGYDKLAQKKGVELVNLGEVPSRGVDIEIDDCHLNFSIPELFAECDLLINVPKLKYMGTPKITCAMKNMYGCNAYRKKSMYHSVIAEAIVGINKLLKTDLVVVDGIVVFGKEARKLNLVMASTDLVSVDVAAARLMGISPKSVRQLSLAAEEGLGRLDFTPVGDFSFFQQTYPKRGFRENLRNAMASVYLRVLRDS